MILQRLGLSAVRCTSARSLVLPYRSTLPVILQNCGHVSYRFSTGPGRAGSPSSSKISLTQSHDILAKQRLKRPVAPHLGVYSIEQTWFGSSAWMRITGCAVMGLGYGYFAAYLFAPLFGWQMGSAVLAKGLAGWPLIAKAPLKLTVAFPFVYHFLNGIKHLAYDMGFGYAKRTIKRADYYLWTFSLLGTFGLVFAL